jgi:hypothetical protein
MSSRKGEQYRNGKSAPPVEGDERGTWPYSELLRMDARFVERMQRAIAAGKEKPLEAHAA